MIQSTDIERIKESVNIVDVIGDRVNLKKEGADYVGICPFHEEKTPSFKVSPSKQMFKCFGCGKGGDVFEFLEAFENKGFVTIASELAEKYGIEIESTKPKEYQKPVPRLQKVSDKILKFFESRGITNNTLLRFGITESFEWMPQFKQETQVICFNYFREGECVNIKFRGQNKAFKLEKDAELIFYNLDAVKDSETVTIVEGEIDCLSLYEANIYDSISVPNGAGVSKQNLQYLDNCLPYFENKKRIVLFTDNDKNGISLRDELVRRLGFDRCFLVQYPSGCKDANDILLKHGKGILKMTVEGAEPFPVEGVLTGFDLASDIINFYDNGYPHGYRVPMPGMEEHVRLQLMLGQFTAVTGIPSHGKSEWVDWLMVLMSREHGWKWGICSPENQPSSIHASKLIQKYYGKSFDHRKEINHRIPKEALYHCIDFINEHFYFIDVDETKMTLDDILKKLDDLVLQKGIKGWLLDPWNKVEFTIGKGLNETQSTNTALTQVSSFCKRRKVHGIAIAHPTKIQKDKNTGMFEVPNMYSISGSAHWYNQIDNGITVYRNEKEGLTGVYIQKVRYDWLGNKGFITYRFNTMTRQFELPNEIQLPSNFTPIKNFYEKDDDQPF